MNFIHRFIYLFMYLFAVVADLSKYSEYLITFEKKLSRCFDAVRCRPRNGWKLLHSVGGGGGRGEQGDETFVIMLIYGFKPSATW